jgi:glycerol-3-phosphate acyltransferase PlsY
MDILTPFLWIVTAFLFGSISAGIVALLLDFFKGAVPVSQAYFIQHFSFPLWPPSLSRPSLGHAF